MTIFEEMSVPFSPPLISEDEIQAVVEVLRSGWIGTGPKVQEFEKALSKYLGVKHAVAVSSCTAALHLAVLAAGVRPGDEVITTPMTFAATANVVAHVGGKPVLADISKDDWNIDPKEIKKHITERTKAVIPVHFAGMPCDLDEIEEVSKPKHIAVIEDAAHAIGASYHGKMIGASGNLVCFSFYPTKNITTIEGGLLTTTDDKVAEVANVLRMHGQSSDAWKRYSEGEHVSYKVTQAGYKYNMTDVQAALGLKQLQKIDKFLDARDRVAKTYFEDLKDVRGIVLPPRSSSGSKRVWHLFSVLIKSEEIGINRDQVKVQLEKAGIGTGIHYEALNTHPFFQRTYGYHEGMFPNAEYVSERTVSLPMSASLTEDQVHHVARKLISILAHK